LFGEVATGNRHIVSVKKTDWRHEHGGRTEDSDYLLYGL